MKTLRAPVFLLLAFALGLSACQPPAPSKPGGLEVGDDAFLWSLPDSSGRTLKLTDAQPGWYLIQILYRGQWCSACMNQLLNLKRDYPQFLALKATIACISVDSQQASADFTASWKFPFPLLRDSNLDVIAAYGAVQPQGHEGKDISNPAVIIVAPNRKIVYKFVGHSPVDIPSDGDLLDWLRLHPIPPKAP